MSLKKYPKKIAIRPCSIGLRRRIGIFRIEERNFPANAFAFSPDWRYIKDNHARLAKLANAQDLGSKFGKISSHGFHLQNSEFKFKTATLTAIYDPG